MGKTHTSGRVPDICGNVEVLAATPKREHHARTPASIKTCLTLQGAITKLNGPTEIDAWWHATFVEVFAVKNHAFAQAIVDGGERYGKPPASYVLHGSTVASFWEVPTKAQRARVAACI